MAAKRVPKGGTRGTVYAEVARLRLADAKALLDNARCNGAVYLAGYAIECQLKYCFCKRTGETYVPAKLETHDWDMLIVSAGILNDLKAQEKVYVLYQALVDQWGPSLRYRTKAIETRTAERLYNELVELYQFLIELLP